MLDFDGVFDVGERGLAVESVSEGCGDGVEAMDVEGEGVAQDRVAFIIGGVIAQQVGAQQGSLGG